MRHRLLPILLCLCLSVSATAQDFAFPAPTKRIYAIKAATARTLLRGELRFDQLPDPGTPYPTATKPESLPPGHYLTARLSGDKVSYTYFDTYKYNVEVQPIPGKFAVRIYDPAGLTRADATVLADGKPVRYREKEQQYRRRDWRIDFLEVAVGGDTLFYDVEEDIDQSRFTHDIRHASANPVGYVVLTPYRFGARSYRYVKRVIRYGRWGMYHYPFRRTINRITNPKPIVGYVTTSQPVYRPGDTLRISAYLTKPKGRPLVRDSVDMIIYSYKGGRYSWQSEKQLEATVARTEKGRYVYELPIPDNWPLDRKYRIDFRNGNGLFPRDISPDITFRVEDYELAEYELAVKVNDDARLPGSAWLDIRTEDINGLALPQGKLEVKVITKRVTAFTDTTSLRLPDLLYRHEEGTDNRRERRITLPDSLFPPGFAVAVKVVTQLTGPSGEYQESEKEMVVDRRYPQVPEITAEGDSLYLSLAPASSTAPADPPETATLETITPQADTLRETITLPKSIAIDHGQVGYRLVYGPQAETYDNLDCTPADNGLIQWSRDTLRLRFANPHGQPFRWELRQQGEVVASGDQDAPAFERAGYAPRAALSLSYQHLSAGAWRTEQQTLTAPAYDERTPHKNILDLTLDQPLRVRPGETVRVALRATDQAGKPASDVRLTAGTHNARFKDSPVKTPSYLRREKRRRSRQSYRVADLNRKASPTPPAWLVTDFGQDTALAYQLHYPDPKFSYLRSLDSIMPDSNYQAHFAPFVIRDHQLKTIRTVFVDHRLAYWWHPDTRTPYSIPVDSGSHKVSLVIDGYRFTKNLYFPARQQLVLSFDAQRWASAGWQREQRKEVPDAEIRAVYDRVFALTGMQAITSFHFRNPATGIVQSGGFKTDDDDWIPLGLASPGSNLTIWLPGQDSLTVRFEPRARYQITPKRERLYPLEKERIKKTLTPNFKWYSQQPGWPVYRYHPREKELLTFLDTVAKVIPPLSPEAVGSRLQLANRPDWLKQLIAVPIGKKSYYKLDVYGTNVLAAGVYDLLYHFHGDSVREQRIVLTPEALRFLPYSVDQTSIIPLEDFTNKTDQISGPSDTIKYLSLVYRKGWLNGTVVDKETGEPLIAVSIWIPEIEAGTVTDFDGNFSIQLPDVGPLTIMVAYTGYAEMIIKLQAKDVVNGPILVEMDPGVSLTEVVVTAYGISKSNYNFSNPKIEGDISQIAAVAAGVTESDEGGLINIRGSRSNAVEYYVDGVRISPTSIPDSELQEANGIVIRGLSSTGRASPLYIVNGTIVENLDDLSPEQIVKIEVLKNADATAVYGTAGANGVVLITTQDGAAGLATTLPPPTPRTTFADYAAFHPELRTDRQGRAEFDVTFPDDITAWNTFAVGQDRRRRVGFATARTNAFLPLQAQLYLPRFLVAGDESEAATLAINRTEEEREVQLTFTDADNQARTQDARLGDSREQRYPIQANGVGDSLTYQFTLQTTDGEPESDGERRSVRVFPVGTEMTAGEHFLLAPGREDLPLDFIRPERGPVTLRIFGNRVERLLADVDYVVDYPYACNEQTASRLLGLLALQQTREAEGKTFRREGDIRKMVRRLERAAKQDGSYGWWPGSPGSTPWVSGHVFRALSAAAAAGYPVHDLEGLRTYLLSALPELMVNDQLSILLTLAEAGLPTTRQELDRLDTIPNPTDYQYLARTRLHQQRGDSIAVDSILARSTATATGGRYWGEQRRWFYRQPLGNRLACGLLAHQIMREAGEKEAADAAAAYLLGRSAGSQAGSEPLLGTNTLESARLIAGLLPDLLEAGTLSPPSVTVADGNTSSLVTALPYVRTIAPAAAQHLRLSRQGSGPVLVSLHQRWFETAPSATDTGFAIASKLVDERGRQLDRLSRGQTAYLEVTVTTAADADYVLLEAPIPAGCSFADRSESLGPHAVHREYRRDRAAIFCDQLPTGTHTYRVALAPRFSGNYTINPARAEMQYVPAVSGNTGLGKVRVGE